MDAKKAVHKHEKAMHPGKPLTKLRKGGKAAEKAADKAPTIREALEKAVAKGDDVGYDRAKIAANYPDTAPPVLAKDPKTGREFVVFTCFNQDQDLDHVDFDNLRARLKANSLQEKLAAMWLDKLFAEEPTIKSV